MPDVNRVTVGPLSPGIPVRIAAPSSPAPNCVPFPSAVPVSRVIVPGPIGPEGKTGAQGDQGPIGITTGFGQVTYTRALAEPGEAMAENTPTPLVFDPDPALMQLYLNPPFAGHGFWDGSKVHARAFADRISVQVNLRVRAQRSGGTLLLELEAGSPAGPIVADGKTLFKPAGVIERVTLDVEFQTIAYVIANGGTLILTSSVPITILRKTVLVAPQSIFVGGAP